MYWCTHLHAAFHLATLPSQSVVIANWCLQAHTSTTILYLAQKSKLWNAIYCIHFMYTCWALGRIHHLQLFWHGQGNISLKQKSWTMSLSFNISKCKSPWCVWVLKKGPYTHKCEKHYRGHSEKTRLKKILRWRVM